MPTPTDWAWSRRLLRRVRDVMAAIGSAEQRLGRVVKIIAADMVAEVCSVYVMRAGGVLELFATEGLNPDAVHVTRLRVGEGLVGEIAVHARAVALADAQAHPNFAYRPETGEEIYQSLMGVPILRANRVLGVLVVQNRTRRQYTEEEVEAVQTVAMVLAELVVGGELISADELLPPEDDALLPTRLVGVVLNRGYAVGTVVRHQSRVAVRSLVAEDPRVEHDRLREALSRMHAALDAMLSDSSLGGGEHRAVLESYRMFAEDRGWLGRIGEAIEGGLTAEAAVQRVQDEYRGRMAQITDPYLRERLLDLEDLSNRLLQHLTGTGRSTAALDLPPDIILVARSMGPAELLDYDRSKLRALVMEEGSPTAHVSIVARAFDIPVLGRVSNLLSRAETGDSAIVDGEAGALILRPREDVLQAYATALAQHAVRRRGYAALRDLPATSRDGVPVGLQINAGLLVDFQTLADSGASGVGLYRSEIAFMSQPAFPDPATQEAVYRRAREEAGGRPIVFRTLDVGADKLLPYWPRLAEDNPAMGWRALRIGLDRPALLRQQLRALLRAAEGGPLSIMFPMVSDAAELIAARALLDRELAALDIRYLPRPAPLRIGVMLEVPALLWQLDTVMPYIHFVSVGSNDLLQFLFASDRGNPATAQRYDNLAPAALAVLRDVVRRCDAAGRAVSVCGEMAGRPLEAMALIGLGYRQLSMPPAAIGPVKTMLRSLDVGPLVAYLDRVLMVADHSLRARLRAYALDHGVVLD